jgi:hypothetical protein
MQRLLPSWLSHSLNMEGNFRESMAERERWKEGERS